MNRLPHMLNTERLQRILVTGADGFVGRHCVDVLLSRGYEVHAVSRHPRSENRAGVVRHQADLLETNSIASLVEQAGCDGLLHLAWIADPAGYRTSSENLQWIEASLELFDAFYQSGGRRSVGTGSCAEYDWSTGFCHETLTSARPNTLYGRCKLAVHTVSDGLAYQHQWSHAWARLFFLYGPGAPATKMPGLIFDGLLNYQPVRCSHGHQRRDFLHVEDAASALVSLLESDVRGVVNVASGLPISLREIAEEAARIVPRGELIQWGTQPTVDNDPPLIVADIRRLTNDVGWQPRIPLPEGVRRTIEWHREHGTAAA